MREILFRGKAVNGGQWIYGHLMEYAGMAQIWVKTDDGTWNAIVDPATVGQYTGLTDTNGVKIFEGDIVKSHYANAKNADFIEQVVFHNGHFCALYQNGTAKHWSPLADGIPHIFQDKTVYMEWCEVIGNIHDVQNIEEALSDA